ALPGGPSCAKVLIKASGPPPRLPHPPGWSEYAVEVSISPRHGGALFLLWARGWAAGLSLSLWHLPRSPQKLAARLGAWAEARAFFPNQSPKPSRADCLPFAGAARVVFREYVNSVLIASGGAHCPQEARLIPA